MDFVFDGAVDPLSVTSRSVRVLSAEGIAVPAELAVTSGKLRVRMDITADLLAEHLPHVSVQLAGLPSPAALRTVDGRRLHSSMSRIIPLIPSLHATSTEAPRLLTVNGERPDGSIIPVKGELVLSFSGILDPATVSPAACPLFPVAGDITLLTPYLPTVRWRCLDERFDLILEVPPGSGRMQCILRRMTVRDPRGLPPEPAGLILDIVAA